ncbi:MAG: hypothetical protein ACLSGB_10545 [Dorea sp.]
MQSQPFRSTYIENEESNYEIIKYWRDQAVLEGIMMKTRQTTMRLQCRKPDGEIEVRKKNIRSLIEVGKL